MPSVLCKSTASKAFLGISKGFTDEFVVVTSKREVEVLNVVDQRCTAAWAVDMDSSLTAATVCCGDCYYTVRDDRAILCWSPDATSLPRQVSLTSIPVFNIHAVRSITEPLVVLVTGTVKFLSQCASTRSTRHQQSRRQSKYDCLLLASCACEWQIDDFVAVVVTVKKSRTGTLLLSVYHATDSVCTLWVETVVAIPLDLSQFQSICLCCEDGRLQLTSVWSDSTLWCQFLSADGSFSRPLQISRFVESCSVDKADVCSLGYSRYAVLAVEDSTDLSKCHISIIDTKHNCVSASTLFDCPQTVDDDSRDLHLCQIVFIGSNLVALCNSSILTSRCEIRSPSLASVVGQQSSGDTKLVTPPISISGAVWLTAGSEKMERLCVKKWYEELFDCEKTPDDKSFDTKYAAGMKQSETSTKKRKSVRGPCEEETEAERLHLTEGQYMLMQTVFRCKCDSKLWPRESILDMIEHFSIPSSQDLLLLAIKHDDAAIVTTVLLQFEDIDEVALIRCLEYVLSLDETVTVETSKGKSLGQQDLFNLILGKPRDDFMTQSSLKLLPYSQVLRMIKLLSGILKKTSQLPIENTTGHNEIQISQADATDWISFLIDAHFAHLILDPEANKLLVKLYKTVSRQVQFSEQLNRVDQLLRNIVELRAVEKRTYSSQYTVELLDV
ncbi:nucleolar protein 11-like [Corticium candelabrum]|uniref:nucleolar protein 11-like n=1 Tax=Corticium candelabrum TaxID=121492 RepID=UPI002E26AE6D|nr:nucleolar protein 11-like [Corticium candelabrum]